MQKVGSSSADVWVNTFFYPCIYLQAHTHLHYSGLSLIIQTQLNQIFLAIYKNTYLQMKMHTYKNKNTHFYTRNQLQQDLENILFAPNNTKQTTLKSLLRIHIFSSEQVPFIFCRNLKTLLGSILAKYIWSHEFHL